MLVAAGDGEGWEEVDGVGVGDLLGDEAGDGGVGDRGEVRAVLLEGADGEHGDTGASFGYVGARGGRQQVHDSPPVGQDMDRRAWSNSLLSSGTSTSLRQRARWGWGRWSSERRRAEPVRRAMSSAWSAVRYAFSTSSRMAWEVARWARQRPWSRSWTDGQWRRLFSEVATARSLLDWRFGLIVLDCGRRGGIRILGWNALMETSSRGLREPRELPVAVKAVSGTRGEDPPECGEERLSGE